MCLLFLYVNPSAKKGEYKLILVNNRDEFYARPTKVAHFWDTGILGGMDAEKGREGGTWLAVDGSGRVGCLLNVFQPKENFVSGGAGRGPLVVNYLLERASGMEYVEKMSKSGLIHNPFHLVTMDPNNLAYDVVYYNGQEKVWKVLEPGCHGFGNSPVDKPFRKIVKGKRNFQEIVETYGKLDDEEQLILKLNAMMQDCEENYPDGQLSEQGQGHSTEFLRGLSSVFVKISRHGYGTRTTTVILVDHTDRVVYKERTMKEPIDLKEAEWEVSEYDFQAKMSR